MLKDFPLSGYEEIRYDFEKGMVAYKPVDLQQVLDILAPCHLGRKITRPKLNLGVMVTRS